MSGLFAGQWTAQSEAVINGNLSVTGDLVVDGTFNPGASGSDDILGKFFTTNSGEVGAGVGGAGLSGIEIERGTETNFRILFDESDDKLKAGIIGSEATVTLGAVGTENYIPYGISGGGRLTENSALTFDGTTLTVQTGSSGASGPNANADEAVFEGSGNSGATILSGLTSNSALYFGNSGDTVEAGFQYSHSTKLLSFRTNGAFGVYMDSAGAFGIGNSSPSEKLDVSGNINLTGNVLVGGTVDGVDVAAHKTAYDAHVADATLHFTEASINHQSITGAGTNTHAQIDTAITASTNHIADATLHFTEGSIDHGSISGLGDDDHTQYSLADGTRNFTGNVTITSGGMDITGNVGMGTTSAAAFGNLHVKSGSSGAASANVNGDEAVFEGSGNSGATILSGLTSNGALYFGNSGDTVEAGFQYNHSTKLLSFRTNGSFGVYMDSAGDFGIGTSSPSEALDVVGNIAVSGTVDGLDIGAHSAADDHTHYMLADGTREFTGNVTLDKTTPRFAVDDDGGTDVGGYQIISGGALKAEWKRVTSADYTQITSGHVDNAISMANKRIIDVKDPSAAQDVATKNYVDTNAVSDHGALTGLTDDDHTQYSLADGTRSFTGAVTITTGGIDVTGDSDIAGDLEVKSAANTGNLTVTNDHATFSSSAGFARAARTANSAYALFSTQSDYDGTPDTQHSLRGDGEGLCDGSWTGGGADYAEAFEAANGEAMAHGTTVVLDEEGKIKEASEGETPIGVISAAPGIRGNVGLNWKKKYLKDDYGAYILDEEGERQLNPSYDAEQEFVTRDQRPEWNDVGLVGQLPITKGQVVDPAWILIKNISETVDLYLVK